MNSLNCCVRIEGWEKLTSELDCHEHGREILNLSNNVMDEIFTLLSAHSHSIISTAASSIARLSIYTDNP